MVWLNGAGLLSRLLFSADAKSTIISDGEADILLGFEPSETLRALNKCNKETVVITNTTPLPPFTVGIGIGTYPDMEELQRLITEKTKRLIAFDASDLANQAGNPMSLNIVLLGALIQVGYLPLSADNIKHAIRTTTKQAFVDTNIKAFELGFSAAESAMENE